MSNLNKRNPIAKAIKIALLAAAATTTMTATTVYAEEADEEDAKVVTITGTRIRSANLTSPSPIQIINSEAIRASGAINLQEMLLENPAFGSPGISRTNSNFSTASAGVSLVDLRNLGSSRTLLLINGRRMVAGVPGSSAVDLNTIPLQFIERVEILTGGASSVYGSDAVAGVVNLILKDDFEGAILDVYYGESKRNDDVTRRQTLTTGVTSADGKGNMMFHLSHSDQGAVFTADRGARTDRRGTLNADGTLTIQNPFFSSFPPQGRFDAGGTRFTYDPSNNLQAGYSTNGNGTIGPNGFNRSAFRTIAIPTERYLFAASGTYEVNDDHRIFFDGSYSNTETQTRLEPFPFASDDIYASGIVPLEFEVQGLTLRNPFVPNAIFDNATDVDNDGLRDLSFFAKRLLDVDNRASNAERGTFRMNFGIDGEFADDWYYDLRYSYGQTSESQKGTGQVNVLNFRHALESVIDVLDLDGDGLTNDAVCLDATARSQGCVPINIYGFNSITPEMAQWVRANKSLNTLITQKVFAGHVTGDLFELPAGALSIASGFEYREETSKDVFDALSQTGQNAGNTAPPTEGEFDVTEYYTEVNIPVIEGLDVRAAYRIADYSTVGNAESWNIGLTYEINDSIRLHYIRAQSTRAPNVGELFTPPSETFPSGLNDVCEGIGPTGGGATGDNCRMDPGVALNIAINGSNVFTQSDQQGVGGFNLGNPDLSEEVGTSSTAGFVITPKGIDGLEGLTITGDYYRIKIADAIVSTPRQFIIDQCYGAGQEQFCSFITRRQAPVGSNNNAGSIQFINSAVSNSGGLLVEGFDLTAKYSADLGPGKFNALVSYNHQIENFVVPLPGAAQDPNVGEIDSPQDKINATFGYRWEDLNVTVSVNHVSAVEYDDQFLNGICPGTDPGTRTCNYGFGAETIVDFQVAYYFTENIEVFAGVDNAFDNTPPLILASGAGNTGTDTASSYDAIGQRWYAGLRATF